MILIVDVCSDRLSYFEFVKPVEDIVKKTGVDSVTRYFLSLGHEDVAHAGRVIVCGTALKDFKYLDNIERFGWMRDVNKPVLGICAGMQVIAKLFGCELVEQTRIGRYRVKIVQKNDLTTKDEFYSYFLNSKAAVPDENFLTLAESGKLKCIVKHKSRRFYGCLFHPETLNPEIITNFVSEKVFGAVAEI